MSDVDPVIERARAQLSAARAALSAQPPGPARDFPRSRTLQWLLSGSGAAASVAFVVMLLSPRPSAVYGALQRLPLPALARFVLAQIAALRGAAR